MDDIDKCKRQDDMGEVQPAPLYKYTILAADSIRILELCREDESGEVACRLDFFNLTSVPVHEAVSYIWGNPSMKVEFHCDSKIIHVISSLKAALGHLQPQSGIRRLWADAICLYFDRYRMEYYYNLRRQFSPPKSISVFRPEQALL